MTERSERDDLFLDTLERDEDLAWRLAEAAARPAPAGLRERIVARHRPRPALWGLGTPTLVPAAIALAVVLFALVPLSLVLVRTQAALEGARAQRDELARVVAAVARDGRVVPMRPSPGAVGRGTLVIASDAQAYLVLDLPEPPPGKAYEAWVIRGGQPLRAGMAPARSGIVTVRLEHAVRPGDVTAVTLEVAAGVDAPTSDPLLVGPA